MRSRPSPQPAAPSTALLLVALVPLAACAGASGSEIRKQPAPDAAAEAKEAAAKAEKQHDIHYVLIRLDQGIDSYVQALASQGEPRSDRRREMLETTIRGMVLDVGPTDVRRPGSTGENFAKLKAIAADGSQPGNQAIALAALGFAGTSDVMPLILQGAQLDDPFRKDRAVLGLAVLKAPATPPGIFESIFNDATHPEDGRVQAAWALLNIQEQSERRSEILAIWQRTLASHATASLPPGVLVSAVRGLGLSRDKAHAAAVAPMLKHPTARVRMAAAVALGRMNAQDQAGDLIALLGPAETVQNVRLYARKALASLAGGADYGYDVEAWRKVFDRGR
jgi:HEAT repeat protein